MTDVTASNGDGAPVLAMVHSCSPHMNIYQPHGVMVDVICLQSIKAQAKSSRSVA